MPNIFQRLKEAVLNRNQETGAEIFYPGYDHAFGLAHPDNFYSMVRADTSWVYSLTNINATSVASTPLRLYVTKAPTQRLNFDGEVISKEKRKYLENQNTTFKYVSDSGKEVIELYEHPFLDLMDSVNPEMNNTELWYLSSKFEDLTGNNYWYIINNQLGLPQEIWVLPSQNMKVVPNKDTFVKEYIYNNGIRDIHIPTEEIIHFKYPSPLDVYYGRGPLAGVVGAANINIMMLQYEEALFKNGAMPSTFIDATGLNSAQAKELSKLIKKEFQGPTKQGRMMVGMGKPERLGFNPKDMNVLLEGKPVKEQLSSAFGVPMSMLGSEDIPLANATAGERQYAKKGLEPRLKMKEQKVNEQLLPRWNQPTLFCAYDNVIPEDKEFSLKENDTYVKNGIWTVNEIRTAQGKEPVEWGDEPVQQTTSVEDMDMEEAAQLAKALEESLMYEMKKLDKKIDKVEDNIDV